MGKVYIKGYGHWCINNQGNDTLAQGCRDPCLDCRRVYLALLGIEATEACQRYLAARY
jgi:hypothetical protein